MWCTGTCRCSGSLLKYEEHRGTTNRMCWGDVPHVYSGWFLFAFGTFARASGYSLWPFHRVGNYGIEWQLWTVTHRMLKEASRNFEKSKGTHPERGCKCLNCLVGFFASIPHSKQRNMWADRRNATSRNPTSSGHPLASCSMHLASLHPFQNLPVPLAQLASGPQVCRSTTLRTLEYATWDLWV